MNEGLGMCNLGATISFAFGPMLGLSLIDFGGYKFMFIVCAAGYLLCGLIASFIRYENKGRQSSDTEVKVDDSYKGVWKMIEKKHCRHL